MKNKKIDKLIINMCLGDKIILINYVMIVSIISGLILSFNKIANMKAYIIYIFITLILSLINNILLTIKNR